MEFETKRTPCPECHAKRGFAQLKDHSGGKCFACGVFIKPPQVHSTAGLWQRNSAIVGTPLDKLIKQKFIDPAFVIQSKENLDKNNFVKFCMGLGIPTNHFSNVGHSSDGGTLFYYQNKDGLYVNAKKIVYDTNGHRTDTCYFIHSQSDGFGQCLYNEFALSHASLSKNIVLVESEKTVEIASFYDSKNIWIGTGGTTGLTKEKAKVLKGRSVLIVFDSDSPGRANAIKTKETLESIGIKAGIKDLFPDIDNGFDIADFFIQKNLNKRSGKFASIGQILNDSRLALWIEYHKLWAEENEFGAIVDNLNIDTFTKQEFFNKHRTAWDCRMKRLNELSKVLGIHETKHEALEFDERAAIMEFEGGLTRSDAEAKAVFQLLNN